MLKILLKGICGKNFNLVIIIKLCSWNQILLFFLVIQEKMSLTNTMIYFIPLPKDIALLFHQHSILNYFPGLWNNRNKIPAAYFAADYFQFKHSAVYQVVFLFLNVILKLSEEIKLNCVLIKIWSVVSCEWERNSLPMKSRLPLILYKIAVKWQHPLSWISH